MVAAAVSYWKTGHMSFGSSKEKIPVQPRKDPPVEEESSSSVSSLSPSSSSESTGDTDGGEDFTDEEGICPDLVVIPSSPFHLSGWGRDLTGRVYKEIERLTEIPVALVECDPIFD